MFSIKKKKKKKLIVLYIFNRYIMMFKQSLWIIGFFFFGKLIYYEVIILKYKIYTQILIKRKFENVYIYMYRLNYGCPKSISNPKFMSID